MLIALALSVAVLSQDKAGPPQIVRIEKLEEPSGVSQAAIDEAVRLLDSEDFDQASLRSVTLASELMLAGQAKQLEAKTAELPDDFVPRLKQLVLDQTQKSFRKLLPSMKHDAAKLYASQFTIAEMRRMREINADPVMIKARSRRPFLEPRLAKIGVDAMTSEQSMLEDRVQAFVIGYLTEKGLANPSES